MTHLIANTSEQSEHPPARCITALYMCLYPNSMMTIYIYTAIHWMTPCNCICIFPATGSTTCLQKQNQNAKKTTERVRILSQ